MNVIYYDNYNFSNNGYNDPQTKNDDVDTHKRMFEKWFKQYFALYVGSFFSSGTQRLDSGESMLLLILIILIHNLCYCMPTYTHIYLHAFWKKQSINPFSYTNIMWKVTFIILWVCKDVMTLGAFILSWKSMLVPFPLG